MKDEQLLKNLIKKGEGDRLEFMEEVSREEIAIILCAFLNNCGGTVLIGVKHDGTVVGVRDSERQELQLKNFLFNSISPTAPILVASETIENKRIIVAKIWNGLVPPYLFDDVIYVRHGRETSKAMHDDITKFAVIRQKAESHWERQPAYGVEIDDLDELEIRNTLKTLA